MIELHLRGRVAPGRRADLIAFLSEAIPFYERPGGIRIRLLWDVADPERFIEVVEYADQGTHDRDQARVEADPTDARVPATLAAAAGRPTAGRDLPVLTGGFATSVLGGARAAAGNANRR